MCIGEELDHAAVEVALTACLLTDEEMAGGAEAWAALPDPFAEVLGREACGACMVHDHSHHDAHSHA